MQSQQASDTGAMASQIILVPHARKSYGRLFQTLQNVKESKLFIEFLFIWPIHLKFIECRK